MEVENFKKLVKDLENEANQGHWYIEIHSACESNGPCYFMIDDGFINGKYIHEVPWPNNTDYEHVHGPQDKNRSTSKDILEVIIQTYLD